MSFAAPQNAVAFSDGAAVGVAPSNGAILIYDNTGGVKKLRVSLDGAAYVDVATGSVAVAGANTEVQYNNAGAFGASSSFTWNQGTTTLTVTGTLNVSSIVGNAAILAITGLTVAGNTNGGIVSINATVGSGTGDGGYIELTAKNAGATATGAGGGIYLLCGNGGGANCTGGDFDLTCGSGTGTGNGGPCTVSSGTSGTGATGNGGLLGLYSGAAVSTNGIGGAIQIVAGQSTGTASGSLFEIRAGTGGNAATAGGELQLTAGHTPNTTGTGGTVRIRGGSVLGATGTGGAVSIDSGLLTSGGTNGAITIGTTNAETVTIGRATKNTIVNGDLVVIGGTAMAIVAKSANYTATAADYTITVDASGASRTITIPNATTLSTGKIFTIKKTDSSANNVTIAIATGTVDGAASIVFNTQYQSYTLQSDGTNWHVL